MAKSATGDRGVATQAGHGGAQQDVPSAPEAGPSLLPGRPGDAGAIRSELEAIGRPIGPCDLLIAGQARARNLILVTANSREFSRVEGLNSSLPSIQGT